MRKEIEAKDLAQTIAFKNMMFAHTFAPENVELYKRLYPDDFGLDARDEMMLEWEIPETADEVERMMDELRATGWSGSNDAPQLPWASDH